VSALFEARGLGYGTPDGRPLQDGINFSLRSNQLLLITGGNGSGKSTLLRILLKKMAPARGTVEMALPFHLVAYIPQLENTEIHLPLTLRDVIEVAEPKVDWERALSFGLLTEAHLGHAWNTASGGERKRTLLTRALLQSPSVLVLDEPFNHLDEKSREAMASTMVKFLSVKDSPRAIVMVSHQGLGSGEENLFDVVPVPLPLRERGQVVC